MVRVITLIFIFSVLLVSCGNNDISPGGSGFIEATDVVVSSENAGKVLMMNFGEGDQINVGDTIGIIDTIMITLRIRQIEAVMRAAEVQIELAGISEEQASLNFNLAEKEFNRISGLLKTGSASNQRFDQAENALNQTVLLKKQATMSLEAARADLLKVNAEFALIYRSLSNCFPVAPIAGRIVNRYIEAGELIAPGSPLVKIARLDTVRVKIYLPPADLTKIRPGSRAIIDPEDGRDAPMTGFVTWISSEAEFTPKNVQTREARADLVYAVKIQIPNNNERLKIGMPVMVKIP